jgi:hypothetical protein
MISKLLDEKLETKLVAARKEIIEGLHSTFLHKIEADIADLKEQQQPTRLPLPTSRSRPQPTRLPLHAWRKAALVRPATRRILLRT